MKVIVDTHIAIWSVLSPEKLSPKAVTAFAEADKYATLFLADISLWEIAMLIHKKRFDPTINTRSFLNHLLSAYNFSLARLNTEIADISVRLPASINKDPADRIIAATSLTLNAPLVTADENLRASSALSTIW